MKKPFLTRALALTGVALLAGMYILAFVFSLMKSETAQTMFRAALGCTILIPVFLYLVLMVARAVRPGKSAEIDAVVFDLGKVLLDFPWDTYTGEQELSPEAKDVILNKIAPSTLWYEFDVNLRPFEDIVKEFVALAPEFEKEIRQVVEHEQDCIEKFWYTDDLIKTLKNRGYKVYYLSNWTKEWYEELKDSRMDFIKQMDGGVFSFDAHLAKPDPAIYKRLLEQYKLNPGRCIFIDDMEANTKAAQKLGMAAITFTDYPDMVEKLAAVGVMV
ncbi:MAG: HAD family phosphatase [Lachnospiraceae bacterium]|nr:HAD family phosphatase [Lachnospiraceae bacterium]